MVEYSAARDMMVESQVRVADVTDRRLLAAMREIPREAFVSAQMKPLAYMDEDLIVKEAEGGVPGRYLMAPAPLAKLVQLAGLESGDVVLVVGCTTGYSAAVLAKLVGSVVALESDERLASTASAALTGLGIDNVAVVTGPLEAGYDDEAPFDAIILDGAVETVPDALFGQLREGGCLVTVVGEGLSASAMLYEKTDGEIGGRSAFNASVMPLPGFRKPRSFVF